MLPIPRQTPGSVNPHPPGLVARQTTATQDGFDVDLQLQGKTALITGSSAGIGFASAVALAREGTSVVLNGRDADRPVDAERRLLSRPGASVRTSAADVSTPEGADDLIEAMPDVDILINNAAALGPQPFTEIPDAEWTRFFETNVMSGVRLSRHYLSGMLTRNSGRILFVSSESAVHVTAAHLHYAVTKTAGDRRRDNSHTRPVRAL